MNGVKTVFSREYLRKIAFEFFLIGLRNTKADREMLIGEGYTEVEADIICERLAELGAKHDKG